MRVECDETIIMCKLARYTLSNDDTDLTQLAELSRVGSGSVTSLYSDHIYDRMQIST
jgi:hypothetical protein